MFTTSILLFIRDSFLNNLSYARLIFIFEVSLLRTLHGSSSWWEKNHVNISYTQKTLFKVKNKCFTKKTRRCILKLNTSLKLFGLKCSINNLPSWFQVLLDLATKNLYFTNQYNSGLKSSHTLKLKQPKYS